MHSKRGMTDDHEKAEPSKRLRINLSSLFCENVISGARAQTLLADAQSAGAQRVKDLQATADKNAHRNILNKLLRT